MVRVLVLGASGMLGSQVFSHLRNCGFDVLGSTRSGELSGNPQSMIKLDIENFSESIFTATEPPLWVINCIGIVKARIRSARDKAIATRVNSYFPHQLNAAAEKFGFRVIQIATDCVYSGTVGQYTEDSPHDPTDIYGMSKSLGEVESERFLNLRCSIIGPEPHGDSSLVEWVRSQPFGSEINGFVNHLWNGVTTLAFAKLVAGIIRTDSFEAGTFHVTPRDIVTKDQLVRLIALRLERQDLVVNPVAAPSLVERSLMTSFPDLNSRLWGDAGYEKIPSIRELVEECPIR